jgi:hypothetical protein
MSRGLHSFCTLAVLLTIPGLLSAATLTVDAGGKGSYTTIQAAVNKASAGDIIIVKSGTYTGTGNCDISVQRKAITIQSSDPNDPNIVAATIINCAGTKTSPHRGFYFASCTGAKLAGLTITNGLTAAGGAIYSTSSVVEVSNCRILNNSTLAGDGKTTLSGGCGGGVYAEASSLKFVDCVISGNTTSQGTDSLSATAGSGGDGAGIYATGTFVEVDGCMVSSNATGSGGASPTTAGRGGDGGGISCDSLSVKNSTFTGNKTGRGGSGSPAGRGGYGGGIFSSRAAVAYSIIEGNTAGSGGSSSSRGQSGEGGDGGGIYCSGGLEMNNSLVVGNSGGRAGLAATVVSPASDGAGAGIWCNGGTIDHCTIVANSAFQSVTSSTAVLGSGLFCSNQTTVTNCILWDNTPDQIAGHDCSLISYCDIQGGVCAGGTGNMAVNPAFVSVGKWQEPDDATVEDSWADRAIVWVPGNYRLSSSSPCIDLGDPGYDEDANAVDVAGSLRTADGRTDIGAYEYQSLVPVYHFESPKNSHHFYTANAGEKNKLITQSSSDWTYKGVSYYAYNRVVDSRLKPVYRFWSDKSGGHFWTISEGEKNKLIAGKVWTYEGPMFYVFAESERPADTEPVYRFWSDSIGGHFYTIDEAEKDRLVTEESRTWTFEGPVWYAYATPPVQEDEDEEEPPADPDTYSFMAGSDAAIYQIGLKAVLDGQEVRLDNSTILFTPALGHMVMDVDLDALTANFTSLFVESEFLEHNVTATTSSGTSTSSHTIALSVYGFFNTSAERGPYAIDSRELSFPTSQTTGLSSTGEDFHLLGAVSIDGLKSDVNLTVEATSLNLQGTAVFDLTGYPSSLGLTMAGPFQWRREGHEDLVAEVTLKGQRMQLYVTSWLVQTTGVWSGKCAAVEAAGSK